jgi:hypothetical protein
MAAVVVIGALVTAATAGGGGGGGGTDVAMVPVDDAAGGAPSTGSGDGSGGDGSGHGPPRPPFTKPDSPTTIADDGATDPGAEPGGDADAVVVSDPGPGTDPAPTPDPSGDPTPDPGPDPAPDPPADTTPPSIGGLTASPARIVEGGSGEFCNRSIPATTTLSATVSDASGVQGVTVAWQGAGVSGSTSMSPSGSTWTAAVTPGPSGTLYAPNTASITWRVTAHDAAGNATENKSTFTLIGC